jgi:hypothetical protein
MSIRAGAASSGGFQRGAKVVKNTAGTAANLDNVPVPWDAEDYDNDSHWASSPNPERLTIGTGYDAVMIGSTVWHDNLAGSRLRLATTVNGSINDDSAVHYTEPIGIGDDPATNITAGPIDVGASTDFYTVVAITNDISYRYSPTGNFWMMVLPT